MKRKCVYISENKKEKVMSLLLGTLGFLWVSKILEDGVKFSLRKRKKGKLLERVVKQWQKGKKGRDEERSKKKGRVTEQKDKRTESHQKRSSTRRKIATW